MNVLPKWMQRKRRRTCSFSPSQMETFVLCPRKWWFKSVRLLYDPPKGSTTFGTVLHAVLERWLSADQTGRCTKTGQEVDLYPPGWTRAINQYTGEFDGEVSATEIVLIQKLVNMAIEEGILCRIPGRKIEQHFKKVIMQLACVDCGGVGCSSCNMTGVGTEIYSTGFIDLVTPEGIEDHKTTSNMQYAASNRPKASRYLGGNLQIMLYARMQLQELLEQGQPLPQTYSVTHNVYLKNQQKPRVKKVSVTLFTQAIFDFWTEKVEPLVRWMAHYRSVAERWHQVPDNSEKGACNAYGGCPYLPICTGREDETRYEDRVAAYKKERYHATASFQATPLTVGSTP